MNIRGTEKFGTVREKPRKFGLLSLLAVAGLLLSTSSFALPGHTAEGSSAQATPAAAELVSAVVANELSDREKQRKWVCLIEKREGKQTLTEVKVDTKDGPLFRLLAIDGAALNSDQRR